MTARPLRKLVSRATATTAVLVVATVCIACASTRPSGYEGTKNGGGNRCQGLVDEARTRVERVIEANRSCNVDADCTDVGLGASCFDSCSRPMAISGRPLYENEVRAANDLECADYTREGCPPLISPPCAPPGPHVCNQGLCS